MAGKPLQQSLPGSMLASHSSSTSGQAGVSRGLPGFGYKGTMTGLAVVTLAHNGYLWLSSWDLIFKLFCRIQYTSTQG